MAEYKSDHTPQLCKKQKKKTYNLRKSLEAYSSKCLAATLDDHEQGQLLPDVGIPSFFGYRRDVRTRMIFERKRGGFGGRAFRLRKQANPSR